MSWIAWIVVGLIAGALAKFIMPGRDPGGIIVTIGIGIIGGIVGGAGAQALGVAERPDGLNIASIVIATVGAIVLLIIYRMVRGRG